MNTVEAVKTISKHKLVFLEYTVWEAARINTFGMNSNISLGKQTQPSTTTCTFLSPVTTLPSLVSAARTRHSSLLPWDGRGGDWEVGNRERPHRPPSTSELPTSTHPPTLTHVP